MKEQSDYNSDELIEGELYSIKAKKMMFLMGEGGPVVLHTTHVTDKVICVMPGELISIGMFMKVEHRYDGDHIMHVPKFYVGKSIKEYSNSMHYFKKMTK